MTISSRPRITLTEADIGRAKGAALRRFQESKRAHAKDKRGQDELASHEVNLLGIMAMARFLGVEPYMESFKGKGPDLVFEAFGIEWSCYVRTTKQGNPTPRAKVAPDDDPMFLLLALRQVTEATYEFMGSCEVGWAQQTYPETSNVPGWRPVHFVPYADLRPTVPYADLMPPAEPRQLSLFE